tara:strand:+ start:229 stop:822 length:594 start_codon:yes stop_codon:yes gene_type:complete
MYNEDTEVKIILYLQKVFYTKEYNLIDKIAKLISSRKYRKIYLLIFLIYLLIKKDIYTIMILPKIFISGIFSRNINIFIKKIFKRPRPFVSYKEILVNPKVYEKKKNTYSFPSNSIQTSLIFYNTLLRLLFDLLPIQRRLFLFLFLIITSLAKIIRGLHYLTDIFFSILIFLFIEFLLIFMYYIINIFSCNILFYVR